MEKLAIAKGPVKIAVLEAENFKKFKTFYLELGANATTVGGANGAGKSTVADIVRVLFGDAKIAGGKKSEILEPLRRGAEAGELRGTLDNGITIEKHITKGGISQAIIKSEDGARFPSPAHLLRELIGDQALAFDPAAIKDMDGDEFRVYLEKALGLDFTMLDAEIVDLYGQRTEFNRTVKDSQAQLRQYPEDLECPDKKVVVQELMEQLEAAHAINAKLLECRDKFEKSRETVGAWEERIIDLTAQLAEAKKELARASKVEQVGARALGELQPADEATLRDQISGAQAINDRVVRREARDLLLKTIKVHAASAEGCTKEMAAIRESKREIFKEAMAKISVKDMAVRDDGTVTLKGIPFRKGQVCDTEILKVGVAIWRALNPMLRTMIVDNGEKLDPANHAALCRAAKKHNFQPLIIRVSMGEECTIILEDGVIQGSDPAQQRPRTAPSIIVGEEEGPTAAKE